MDDYIFLANTLKISSLSKSEALEYLEQRVKTGQKTFITTLYSEFLFAALKNKSIAEMLNTADLAVADGVSIQWAAKYMTLPFQVKNYYLRIIEGFVQGLLSGLKILIQPNYIRTEIPEKIVGADFIWNLASLAVKNNKSVYLLGGFGDVPKQVAHALQKKYPNLKIAGWSNKNPNDASVLHDLKLAKPDFLFVAYGPIRQEKWISENMRFIPARLFIGLGGTFDYITGLKKAPPKYIRKIGLEWLYRLVTQPSRFLRIVNGTYGLCLSLLRVKVFSSLNYRKSVVTVVFNEEKKVLVYQRNPDYKYNLSESVEDKNTRYSDYWQLPQGGLELGENLEAAARRELAEELNIRNLKFIYQSEKTYSYLWNNSIRRLIFGNVYKYKGQEQRILFFLYSEEDKILVDHDEVINFKWVKIEEILSVVHAERRGVTNIVVEEILKNEELKKRLRDASI